jgi:hypothetical protein
MAVEPKEFIDSFSDFVNNMSDEPKFEAIELMTREHRTLQQSMTRFSIWWLERLARYQDFEFDLRNEASVRLAKEFVENIPVEERALPFI